MQTFAVLLQQTAIWKPKKGKGNEEDAIFQYLKIPAKLKEYILLLPTKSKTESGSLNLKLRSFR